MWIWLAGKAEINKELFLSGFREFEERITTSLFTCYALLLNAAEYGRILSKQVKDLLNGSRTNTKSEQQAKRADLLNID